MDIASQDPHVAEKNSHRFYGTISSGGRWLLAHEAMAVEAAGKAAAADDDDGRALCHVWDIRGCIDTYHETRIFMLLLWGFTTCPFGRISWGAFGWGRRKVPLLCICRVNEP